jgi:hypothetical protein
LICSNMPKIFSRLANSLNATSTQFIDVPSG